LLHLAHLATANAKEGLNKSHFADPLL